MACYLRAVQEKDWNHECHFDVDGGSTQILLSQKEYTLELKGKDEENELDRIIIIDNTQFPRGGAMPEDEIILEYASSTTYNMSYNLRNISILMGLVSMILLFSIGSLAYLTYKLKLDIKRKFLTDADESDQEEEEAEADDDQKPDEDKKE